MAFEIHTDIATKVNFASYQNSYPVIRDLRIENLSDARFEAITLMLSANPPFFKPRIWHIDRIEPLQSHSLSNRDLELDSSFLMLLTESMRGSLTLRLEREGEILAEKSHPIELLAVNEWGGASYMPELLAAFVTPNDPAIDNLLRAASAVLRSAQKQESMEGYQSGKKERVWEIASAIYTAIANLDLTYAEPPASFEGNGQKIRTPSQIQDCRVATCMDTTLLFASAFEQAGLNALVVLIKGHAFVGIWLEPETLSTILVDDAETLRKRSQLHELILVETTFTTSHPAPPFSKAIAAALARITPDNDESFVTVLDVKRARMQRIYPVGFRPCIAKAAEEVKQVAQTILEEAPTLPSFNVAPDSVLIETPAGRLERWQRRLLDLTLRNPLLNHHASTTSLQILCPDPGGLEDKLAAGSSISIHTLPKQTSLLQDEAIYKSRTGGVVTTEYAREALTKNQILVDLPEAELARRAVEIYRKTQTALQEGGSNTLFLALGYLLWRKDDKEDKKCRAPLILLPVSLERKSVRSGVKLVAYDDEPRFNTTLLEMLRKDFDINIAGLDGALPTDSSGVDVTGVWNIVRQAVKDVPGFEVVEDTVLGHFSFAKYLMWKDLVDRADILRENPVVRHLIETPRARYASVTPFVEKDRIDRDYSPSDLLTPLPADASQMSVIASAEKGKDFVVIGPPGTGKSQTISNMIAHLLGTGKRVLFVSEKTAALEVVYRRLADVGLGRFCLELHSSKASKNDVLKQFRGAWEDGLRQSPVTWKKEAERLRILRDNLNLLVDHLHFKHRNGMSAHYAMGLKIKNADIANQIQFSWPKADQHSESELEAMRDAVNNLAIQMKSHGDISKSPLSMISCTTWSPQWEEQVVQSSRNLHASYTDSELAFTGLADQLGLSSSNSSVSTRDALQDLTTALLASHRTQAHFALDVNGAMQIEALEQAVTHLNAFTTLQSKLSCPYELLAWKALDGAALAQQWQSAQQKWILPRILLQRKITLKMRTNGALGIPDSKDFETLAQLRIEGEAIDRLAKDLSNLRDWRNHTTNPQQVAALAAIGRQVLAALAKFSSDPQRYIEIKGKIRTLLQDGNDLLAPDASIGKACIAFNQKWNKCCESHAIFIQLAGISKQTNKLQEGITCQDIQKALEPIATHRQELKDWCSFQKRKNEALELDLLPMVNAIEAGTISAANMLTNFETAYCTWWSGAIIGEDEVLRTFSAAEHSEQILQFRDLDRQFRKLTSEYIAAKLSSNLPLQDDVKANSQWGILHRELQKKMRHKPVRQLVQEIPEVLATLAPCMMMSPLSIAQYLPANLKPFDVVIFDEASQITVWDAIGAIARGRQVIVAGDPKQMPPTNFFARSDDDPDGDIEQEGDLESILDEMLGASIPKRVLNLHYRSRKESLIAFSNTKYYDNQLVTFPAPLTPPDLGVTLVRPEGFYARGKARHNEGEAKAIVAEVVRRLTDENDTIRKRSIGIVTFNTEQQTLIENLLDEARSSNSEIEWAFSRDSVLEPVFVKNLEAVQGDERDVILFSVAYAPDQSGHMTMNFGPLNRSGGERRLNVALTRARCEMMIFSTLKPELIDLSRTKATAVVDLKHFLEYAEKGIGTLGSFIAGSIGDFESPFEIAVAKTLRDKGWKILPQIGVSAYRIDLGVIHPDEPGNFLAGVECDGAMYHSSAYARERDQIRQTVLEGLGWTLLRVWSTDWWTNSHKAANTVHENLNRLLENSRNS